MSEFATIGIITRRGDTSVSDTVNDIQMLLKARGCRVLLHHSARNLIGGMRTVNTDTLAQACNLVIIVGGDGTLLNAVRSLAGRNIPLVGINRGRLGFLVDVSSTDQFAQLQNILDGRYVAEERMLMSVEVRCGGEIPHSASAFNDVVLRATHSRMIEFETSINGLFVNRQRADGIIISTPSGSTAYSLSSGGPILHPTLNVILLQPICSHTLNSRPILVHADSQISIRLVSSAAQAQLVSDGQVVWDMHEDEYIHISRHPHQVRLLHPSEYNYYELLRAKLNWS